MAVLGFLIFPSPPFVVTMISFLVVGVERIIGTKTYGKRHITTLVVIGTFSY